MAAFPVIFCMTMSCQRARNRLKNWYRLCHGTFVRGMMLSTYMVHGGVALLVKSAIPHSRVNLNTGLQLVLLFTKVVNVILFCPSYARTVVRECCKGDDESQWERGKFDPPPPKIPLTDGHQNLCR